MISKRVNFRRALVDTRRVAIIGETFIPLQRCKTPTHIFGAGQILIGKRLLGAVFPRTYRASRSELLLGA